MSKTVKRVSKTVKRVMRVMMIGLVAMLGAKAEAHYIVVKGKVKFCSIVLMCSEAYGCGHTRGDHSIGEVVVTKRGRYIVPKRRGSNS